MKKSNMSVAVVLSYLCVFQPMLPAAYASLPSAYAERHPANEARLTSILNAYSAMHVAALNPAAVTGETPWYNFKQAPDALAALEHSVSSGIITPPSSYLDPSPTTLKLKVGKGVVMSEDGSVSSSPLAANGTDGQNLRNALSGPSLSFIENRGQLHQKVRYYAKSGNSTVFFTDDEIVFDLKKSGRPDKKIGRGSIDAYMTNTNTIRHVVRLKLKDANPKPFIEGKDKLPGTVNYFIGNDPSKWRTDVPTFGEVYYKDVYAGIDMRFYAAKSGMEYDFIVRPGGDPEKIKLAFEGADGIEVDKGGSVSVKTSLGDIRQHAPHIYQVVGGKKVEIGGRYEIHKNGGEPLSLCPDHNTGPSFRNDSLMLSMPSFPDRIVKSSLSMDAVLGNSDMSNSAGFVLSSDSGKKQVFSVAVGFVFDTYDKSKALIIDPVLDFSTYLGGSFNDYGTGIKVDTSGVYITGYTDSLNFPTDALPLQAANSGGYDIFITKIDASGSGLIYSTYLGGSGNDYNSAIAVNASGYAYITGQTISPDFPMANPFQSLYGGGNSDGFVVSLSPGGNSLAFSTYMGGTGNDGGRAIDTDGTNAFITGHTNSTNFPITGSAFFSTCNGCPGSTDAFIVKLTAAGSLDFSTYYGGSGNDIGNGITVAWGFTYIVGGTTSTDFPITGLGAVATYGGGASDSFVAKMDITSSVGYSTYLGGSGDDNGRAIAVDDSANAYVTGSTTSVDFPVVSPVHSYAGGQDVFITKLDTTGSGPVYSTYLGGSGNEYGYGLAIDSAGRAHVTGYTDSSDFPASLTNGSCNGCPQTTDAFYAKLDASGALEDATYLGGSGDDAGWAVAVDSSGSAYITGYTTSADFPTASALYGNAGGYDAFVTKISFPCSYSITPISANFPYTGGTGSIDVTAPAGCAWNVSTVSLPSSMTITSALSGTGNGTITYSISQNTSGLSYGTGFTLLQEGVTFNITQDGDPNCTYSISPLSMSYGGAGGTGTINVTAPAGCTWNAGVGSPGFLQPPFPWISITSGTSGSGSGTVAYSVAPSSDTSLRSGFIGVAAQTFSITQAAGVCPAISLSTVSLPYGTKGKAYNHTITANGGTAPYSYSIATGTLPSGITLSTGGVLSGTPAELGVFNFTVLATDANGCSGSNTYTLNISCPTITIKPATLPDGTIGSPYSQRLTAGGGTAPYTFSLLYSETVPYTFLPPGLSLSPSGVVSGIPTEEGSFSFMVIASDEFGCSGSQLITINITGANNICTYSLWPTSQNNVPAAGGTGYSFTVNTAEGCTWTAGTTDSWITVKTTSGTGTGPVTYDVSANSGYPRSGTIIAGGQVFTVTQAIGCFYSISPTSATDFPSTGGRGTFSVTASDSACSWTAESSDPSWLETTSTGTGSGTGSFTVAANTGGPRSASISVNGQSFIVTQSSGCAYTFVPASQTVPAAGGSFSIDVTATSTGCAWTADTTDPWITGVSGGATGNGSVTYSVAANPGTARSGAVTIGGQSFTVSQDSSTTFAITASSGPGGHMYPQGVISGDVGSEQTFYITPDPGYVVLDVIVDGRSMGPMYALTLRNITTDHTISVVFGPAY